MAKKKVSLADKEKQLVEKQEIIKRQLRRLHERRKMEIGALAYKHGLHELDNDLLEKRFEALAKELLS